MEVTAETVQKDVDAYLGDYAGMVKHRSPLVFGMWTIVILLFGIWRIGGLMLLGMAFMKAGVFSAKRSQLFYTKLMLYGYGIGVPFVLASMYFLSTHNWDEHYFQLMGIHWNYIGSVLVGIGHIGLIVGFCKRMGSSRRLHRISAVGRMAFTNYLMQTILCTTLFYGYGFGLYGSLDRVAQMGVVVVIWGLQLWWSPLWLESFRYGPAEYVWRSLSYGKLPPFRRQKATSV